jgi:hypothetical protein
VPFTAEEKVRIRHHMGYLNVTNAATFSLGIPQAVETQFMVENAFNLVLPEAEGEVRRHVGILNGIEDQMVCNLELLAVTKIGEVGVREDEQDRLKREYLYWQQGLANAMGIVANPFDKRYSSFGGATGGLNVSVVH